MSTHDILRIKEILKQKEMSLQDFAKSAGLSYTYASEIVRNVKFPRPDNLMEIANALDVDLKDLFISTKEKDDPISAFEKIREIVENQLHRGQ